MKFTNTFSMLATVAMLAAGCGKAESKKAPAVPDTGTQSSKTVSTFKYYKGGFYPPPDLPPWSHDMIIKFTTSGFFIEAKHPDPLCGKAGEFSQAEAIELFALVSNLIVAVKAPGGPIAVDAGVEFIEITLQDGTKSKYHLMNMEVPVGEMFAVNPTELSNYLKDLEASLPVVCQ